MKSSIKFQIHCTQPGCYLFMRIVLILLWSNTHISFSSAQGIIPQCGFLDLTEAPSFEHSQPESCGSTLGSNINFIPASTDPIKYIDVVINVMQKESPSDPENFEDNSTHRAFLLDIVNNACNLHVFQTNDEPAYNGTEHPETNHIPDVKIRLNVVAINFIEDNTGWNNNNSITGHYNYTNNPRHQDVALNIFLVEGLTVVDPITHNISLWGLGGIGNTQYVMMNGMFKVYDALNGVTAWSAIWMQMGELLAHEVGHTFGLSHSWLACSSTITDDIDPCPHNSKWCYPYEPTPVGQLPCVNNCMGYSVTRRWFSPKQIGLMHQNLTNRDISRFVRHEKVTNQNIEINSDQTWNINRWVFGDILIKSGKTLVINSKVYMPLSSQIQIERGGRLILDCAQITTCREPINSMQILSDGDYWSGIRVWGNAATAHTQNMHLPTSTLETTKAGILISDESMIDHAKTAISTRNPTATYPTSETYFGGFMYITNTKFRNNRRSIEFMKFDFPNFSFFDHCEFTSTNNDTRYGITMWAIRNMRFFDCTFTNISKCGVLGWDANFQVSESEFNNVHHGMESYSSVPLVGVMVSTDNVYNNCHVGVMGTNCQNAQSLDNEFNDNYFGESIIGGSRFIMLKNIFDNCGNGINLMMTSRFGDNQIRCNNFIDNEIGIAALGDNEGTRFVFNDFENTEVDGDNVNVTHYAGLQDVFTGKIRYAQSWNQMNTPDVQEPAGNKFTTGFDEVNRHIVTLTVPNNTNSSDEFIYHHSNQTVEPRVYPNCGINGTCSLNGSPDFKFNYSFHSGTFSNACGRSISNACYDINCYDDVLEYYDEMKQAFTSTPSTANKELYQIARSIKYYTLDTLVRDYLDRNDYSGLDAILQSDNETFAKRARIGLKILQGNFTGARSLISTYTVVEPGDQDFLDIQSINIDRLESRTGLSSQQISDLQVLISDRSVEKGFARAILSHELDSLYEPELGELEINPRSLEAKDHKLISILVSPNPTDGIINIEVANKDILASKSKATISVFSIDGRIVLNKVIDFGDIAVDLSNFESGLYILNVTTADKELSYSTKIALTK